PKWTNESELCRKFEYQIVNRVVPATLVPIDFNIWLMLLCINGSFRLSSFSRSSSPPSPLSHTKSSASHVSPGKMYFPWKPIIQRYR
ncbi:hypothetical protein RB213_012488, partial [Colletotrichum asianum]